MAKSTSKGSNEHLREKANVSRNVTANESKYYHHRWQLRVWQLLAVTAIASASLGAMVAIPRHREFAWLHAMYVLVVLAYTVLRLPYTLQQSQSTPKTIDAEK